MAPSSRGWIVRSAYVVVDPTLSQSGPGFPVAVRIRAERVRSGAGRSGVFLIFRLRRGQNSHRVARSASFLIFGLAGQERRRCRTRLTRVTRV